jgi:DNA invertase Pin-like site-specific DNA recombinase
MATYPNGNGLQLEGAGAAYLRVSGDRQELARQLNALAHFEQRHGVTVPPARRFEDHMPRDLSAQRPDFQRMLKAVRAGTVKWIFIDSIERFGFADEWELADLLGQLRKAGCRLLDARDEDWTATGLMSFFRAGLAGHESKEAQRKTSWRSLGGMIEGAKAGEFMGGPAPLGLDLGCFDKATGAELYRVIWEGRDVVGTRLKKGKPRPDYRIRRRRVYPDGRTERLDGPVTSLRTSEDTQLLRFVPTRDPARLAAARGVFRKYASEAVSFTGLARWLNQLGIRNSFGKRFQARDVSKMLENEVYLGYPTFGKRRKGRFYRPAGGGLKELEPELKGKDTAAAPEDVVRPAQRLFEPIVDEQTWEDVQTKLARRPFRARPPKNPELYLARLVVCAGCGQPMIARADRQAYFCSTWEHYRARGALADSPCERNGVRHAVLNEYLQKYLDEAGHRLDQLTAVPPGDAAAAGRLEDEEGDAHRRFVAGFARLTRYLAEHDPRGYNALLEEFRRRDAEDRASAAGPGVPAGTVAGHLGQRFHDACAAALATPADPAGMMDEYVARCVDAFRAAYDPGAGAGEVAALNAEQARLVERWADLPTKRAKELAAGRLKELEARITELERQQADLADEVTAEWAEVYDLQQRLSAAREALAGDESRRKAQVLRELLAGISCEFVVTGRPSRGRSRLVAVTFAPAAGAPVRLEVKDGRERSSGGA